MLHLLALAACTKANVDTFTPPAPTGDTAVQEVPWSLGLPALDAHQRVITHLHSPWSHDACDGDPLPYGEVNEPCLQDLRAGLCAAAVDVAFLSDHPAHFAEQEWVDAFHERPGDTRESAANLIHCDDGHVVRWQPGVEDELMPLGLDAHVPGDAAARDDLYNRTDDEAVAAFIAAGAKVYQAHTEGKDPATLRHLQDVGLTGLEIWNLHAMFDPTKRGEDLGLDPLGWAADIAPFTSPTGTAEPDLFVLGVLEKQAPSLARFDELLARGPVTGILGTDAHQNVLPLDLRDGERGDSYRRMLRWMSNHVSASDPGEVEEALAAGRSMVVFEILGTPKGFVFEADDGTPMGGTTSSSTLRVGCPVLHPESPRGLEVPELTVSLLRDGQPFATGCGEHEVGPGVYRVEVDMVPRHLVPFLGDDVEPWMRPFPWILSNAIRVE